MSVVVPAMANSAFSKIKRAVSTWIENQDMS